MMLRYFMRRSELVRQMFGADTLKDSFDRERSAILGARLRLLVERREMVGPKEGLPTAKRNYKKTRGLGAGQAMRPR